MNDEKDTPTMGELQKELDERFPPEVAAKVIPINDEDAAQFMEALTGDAPITGVRVIPIVAGDEGEAVLTVEQLRRCVALEQARRILGDTKGPKGPLTAPTTAPPTASDLIRLAAYIVVGAK